MVLDRQSQLQLGMAYCYVAVTALTANLGYPLPEKYRGIGDTLPLFALSSVPMRRENSSRATSNVSEH
jgi:hypothetical protein